VKTITVQVREDHLETLSRTKPMNALAELIWNALDADATQVRVEFIENEMEGVQTLRVVDNGHGLAFEEAVTVFQNLGGSWKREGNRSAARNRVLHGKYGKGRFRAFSLGGRVEWQSVYRDEEETRHFTILGKAETLGEFSLTEPGKNDAATTGMVVEISNLFPNVNLLRGVKAQQEVTDIFALYLRQYPDTRIYYDNTPLDPAHAEAQFAEYELDEMVMQNGERVQAALTVVEWNLPGKRGVLFCDENGFMLHNPLPRLHFRGFSYTAYLKSSHVAALDREGLLQAEELCPDVRQLMDAARAKLREHFTLREAERAQDTLAEWRELGIYPYEGYPKNDAEANERRIFDIYATHLNQICPDFATSSARNRRLILRLVRELVHGEPTRMARILDELLEFPEEKEDAVLELLQV
jgi:hypothetical protein